MTTQANQESYSFQAEVVQILDLMIHSLYSNKEIFLRELISNASDAIDRLRFEAIAEHASCARTTDPLQIRVSYDTAARTITIADNGIGMSRDEVIEQHRHHRQVRHPRVPRRRSPATSARTPR